MPVPLEGIRKSLRNQMGMTAMFSYLNRRAVPAEEMWEVVAGLGHFSVGHAAHLSFVLVGHSCAVENEINSQRDVVHLGRLTVARTRAQKDPPLVVQLPELLPAYKELRHKVEAWDRVGRRGTGRMQNEVARNASSLKWTRGQRASQSPSKIGRKLCIWDGRLRRRMSPF